MRRAIALLMGLACLSPGLAVAQTVPAGEPFDVVMVTWRGCEEACQGFWDHLEAVGLDVSATILDAGQDAEQLPAFVEQIREQSPDLVVTWGTSVTLGITGTLEPGPDARVDDIPTVFMIVADPVGADIIEDTTRSGRDYVTGTYNRVPEAVQMRVLADYLPFERLGLVYNDDELNAVLKADEVRRVAVEQGFEVVARVLATDDDGAPMVEDIPRAVGEVASAGADLIYLGSSSFLLANADVFTLSALEHGLPVATAYEAIVRDSHGLVALGSAYYNVGQLAGWQAERILRDGLRPGDLEVVGLDRFSVVINMDTARELGLYPPMLLLRVAEVVSSGQ